MSYIRSLKSCPFCGEEIKHYSVGYTGPIADSLSVQCDKCHMYMQIDLEHIRYGSLVSDNKTIEDLSMDAIDIFNNRPDSCSNSNHCENFTN